MNYRKIFTAAGAAFFASAVSASAAVIGFDFEDANNGWSTYESQGYIFEPINLNSSTRCADDGPNPKHCFLEVTQGDPTELMADTETDPGEERWEDGLTTDDEDFDLLAFYINFQGAGANDDNFMRVYDHSGVFDEITETWSGGAYDFIEFQLDASYLAADSGINGFTIYEANAIELGPYEGVLNGQTGYVVVIADGFLEGATSVFWNASDGANNRVDCVYIGSEAGDKDTFGVSQTLGNCGPPEIVPLPAAGWLLIGGLASLVAVRKRYTA